MNEGAIEDLHRRVVALEAEQRQQLRDQFAMAVLSAVYEDACKYNRTGGFMPGWQNDIAREVYDLADAMLAVRDNYNC